MKCPVCNVDLVMSERQGIEIDYCPQCRGVWLDRGELDKIIERSQAMPAETSPGRRENIEDSRHYEDKHHEGEHDKYGHKGHKRKSFFSELFD
jgi:Zn-finger nucleic acid-binding protein